MIKTLSWKLRLGFAFENLGSLLPSNFFSSLSQGFEQRWRRVVVVVEVNVESRRRSEEQVSLLVGPRQAGQLGLLQHPRRDQIADH